MRLDIKGMRNAIDANTVCIVGSCPDFPFGNFDPMVELSNLALDKNVGLHSDCCFGSYFAPFIKEAGYEDKPFDFRVPGITSISCDTHKYGLGPKGMSILMFRHKELRRACIFTTNDWCGGLYPSTNLAGSRPGNIIAGTWAAVLRTGRQG